MTITHLKNYANSHPINFGGIIGTVLIFAAVGLVVALVSRFGFNADQAAAIIAENKAPKTLELVGTIALALLLSRSIFKGPSGIPKSAICKWLMVGLPSAVVSIAAAFTGVALGSLLGYCSWGAVPANNVASQAGTDLKYAITLLAFSYFMSLVLTIDKTTAPKYSNRQFQFWYRVICLVFMVFLLIRSGLILLLLSRGGAA